MEKKLLDYEKFIEKRAKEANTAAEKAKLLDLHRDMLANFQHERLMHLIITLFFVFMSIAFLFIAAWAGATYSFGQEMMPLYILLGIMVILTGFYVKHYYVLENHIQALYKFTEKLRDI